MKTLIILLLAGLLYADQAGAQFSFGKIDSTLKMGKTGYRVQCKNKNVGQNELTIIPLGFESGTGKSDFYINGRLARTEIDDLNGDGLPDLVLYIYADSNAMFGTVYAFLSEDNKSITPCLLPDTRLQGKINSGYKGHDQFSLLGSYLQQKFPIYKSGDDKDKPTGGTRVILYQLIADPDAKFKFDIIRSYDTP